MDFSPFSWIQQPPVEVTLYSKESTMLADPPSRGLSALKPPPTLWYSSLRLLTSWANCKLCLLKITSKQGNSTVRKGEEYLRRMVGVFFSYILQLWTSLSFFSFSFISNYSLFSLNYCQCIMQSGNCLHAAIINLYTFNKWLETWSFQMWPDSPPPHVS